MTSTPAFEQAIRQVATAFVNGTGSGAVNSNSGGNQSVFAAGANGSRVKSIIVSTNDTASTPALYLTLYNGTTAFTIAEIPFTSLGGYGSTSAPTTDVLKATQLLGLPMDAFGNRYLDLPTGWSLYIGMVNAVTAAKQTNVFVSGADF